jgi:hypothetical protein
MRPGVSPLIVAAAVLAAAAAPPAFAEMYKCAGDGGPVYQDAPCPSGRELRNFSADPATVSVVPMRPPPGSASRLASPPRERPVKPAKVDRKAPAAGDPAERRHLQLGMHEGEVLARLGSPDLRSGRGSGKVSRWTYMPVPGDPQTLTTVVFEYGKVIEVERKVVP